MKNNEKNGEQWCKLELCWILQSTVCCRVSVNSQQLYELCKLLPSIENVTPTTWHGWLVQQRSTILTPTSHVAWHTVAPLDDK